MSFAVGSLVSARGREWVVLPGTADDLVMVRPLGGTDDETTGILTALEPVAPAAFALPGATQLGDHRSARLLRDALRLGFRSSAGPFRSFGAINVEPRPYQLVPLLMALRLDPVRLLVADDVGIGKTIEASLIAKELLEQGDVTRLAVLCPPHLAEQWQAELAAKFHLDAELVLASTAARLERGLPVGRTLFQEHPIVVVSTDYIKADRHRDDFIRTAPELVIVDEAHTCTVDLTSRSRARQQRHELVAGLAADPTRHLILVTATPHSGKEGAFRSLLALLDADFAGLPDDLSGDHNRRHRERLARHLVQRRRPDIRDYLGTDTSFPERVEREVTYRLDTEYARLFDDVLRYAREIVRDPLGGQHRQRVRWWSALALLRSMASSPAAAAAALRTRAPSAATDTVEEADALGRQTVLDQGDDDEAETTDVVAGGLADDEDGDGDTAAHTRRLKALAKRAEALTGNHDRKLAAGTDAVATLLAGGYRPIVFCRFIPTAEYVAAELRTRLRGTEVTAVTGTLPPEERETRIAALAEHPKRVLVATDCLSEGINLQDHFDAVVHYDLPWNPTRLEQREGRVDRFGQVAPQVRVVTLYGEDNGVDRIVLDVLLRKHRAIRKALGVSIPVPGDTNTVIEAVAEGLLAADTSIEQVLPGMDDFLKPRTKDLADDWDRSAAAEKRSRTVFAQHGIKVDEVAREVDAVRDAIGSGADVEAFVRGAVTALGGQVTGQPAVTIDLTGTPAPLRDTLGTDRITGRFAPPVGDNEAVLGRTHPVVSGLASYVLSTALDPQLPSIAARSGVIRTAAVTRRTTLVVVRFRFHLVTTRAGTEHPLLAEDAAVVGFTGAPDHPTWLDGDDVTRLLDAEPAGNVHPGQAAGFVDEVLAAAPVWQPWLDGEAGRRAEALRAAHERVREAARARGARTTVTAQLPADVLGLYVYLPI